MAIFSFGQKSFIEPGELSSSQNLAPINKDGFEVLNNQLDKSTLNGKKVDPEYRGFEILPLKGRPTEALPNTQDNVVQFNGDTQNHNGTEVIKENNFRVNLRLVSYIEGLKKQGTKLMAYYLRRAESEEELREIIEKDHAQAIIDDREYEKARSLISKPDDGGLAWPPPEDEIDNVEAVDLWALREAKPTVNEAQKENKDSVALEPALSEAVLTPTDKAEGDEYNKLISLTEDKPLIPVVAEAENSVPSAEPVIAHDSSEKTRVEGDADLVLEEEVLRFLGVYDYEEARLRIEQIKNEEKKKDLLTLMESLKETTNRIPAVPKPGKTVSVVGQDAPIIQDDVQETGPTDSTVPQEVLDGTEGDEITAESFDELYEKIRQTDGIQSSYGHFTPEEWIEKIEYIRYHPMPVMHGNTITRNKGLRRLVFDLIKKESAVVSLDDKYEKQALGAIEYGSFEAAKKSIGEIDDVGRRESLLKLIDAKIKEREAVAHSVDPVISPVSDDVAGKRYELGDSLRTVEIIKNDLDVARENYAMAKIEFGKKNTKYNKVKGSLQSLLSGGILSGRSKEKSPMEIELDEAQKNLDETLSLYVKEKSTKKDAIINSFKNEIDEKEKNGSPLTSEQKGEIISQIKIKLLEQAEKEWDLLQGQTAELSLSESEKVNKIKEVMAKGLKVWSKVPMGVRLLLAPILIGTGVGLTAGLGAGALYAGTRLGRGLGGMAGSRIAGSLYDKRVDRINTEAHEGTVSSYTDENSGKSFEEREVDYMKAREEEAKRKNSQRIKKAMVMVGAGAGAGILTGLAESALSSGGAVSAAGSAEAVDKPKVSGATKAFDGVIKPGRAQASVLEAVSDKKEVGTSGLDAVKAPAESMTAPVTVELSSKGFLQDIHYLKARIIGQYGDKIPPEIQKNIMDRPVIDIAKEYGLYKPGDVNESAMGYAGEKLSLDSNGKLIIERVDGTKETLSGLGRESVKVAVPEVDTNTPSVPTPEKLADVPVDTKVIETKVIPEWDSRHLPVEKVAIPDEPEIVPTVDMSHPENLIHQVEHNGSLVDVVTEGEGRVVKIGDQIIGHDKPFGDSKILVLDDKFQDGPKYKDIREAFAKAFEKSAKVDQIGQNPMAVEFDGGKIYIIQGLKDDPMGMKVLLNGKEIAHGSMEVKGSVLGPKLKFDDSLKQGWFMDKNAYVRAFEFTKKALSIK